MVNKEIMYKMIQALCEMISTKNIEKLNTFSEPVVRLRQYKIDNPGEYEEFYYELRTLRDEMYSQYIEDNDRGK